MNPETIRMILAGLAGIAAGMLVLLALIVPIILAEWWRDRQWKKAAAEFLDAQNVREARNRRWPMSD